MNRTYADYAWDMTAALLAIDSPSGYTAAAAKWVQEAFSALGFDAQITRKKHVSAVEVKSENDYTTSSLDKFRRKFGQSISAAYIVHPGDIRQKDGILYMPIYMTPWLTGVSPA